MGWFLHFGASRSLLHFYRGDEQRAVCNQVSMTSASLRFGAVEGRDLEGRTKCQHCEFLVEPEAVASPVAAWPLRVSIDLDFEDAARLVARAGPMPEDYSGNG